MVNRLDIIGDIHGHYDQLRRLVTKMGYDVPTGKGFVHPEGRKLLFLGDLIDRGEQIREVVESVRNTVESGNGYCVMGNHESNFICWNRKGPDGEYLRVHSEEKRKQCAASIAAGIWPEHENWLAGLPLYLEFGNLRAVHASWSCSKVKELYGHRYAHVNDYGAGVKGVTVGADFWIKASRKRTPEHDIFETLLKGYEHKLPDRKWYLDKERNKRTEFRIAWWKDRASIPPGACYGDIGTFPKGTDMSKENVDDKFVDKVMKTIDDKCDENVRPITAFGHYWMTGDPVRMSPRHLCLDWSVASNGGKLCAYRWDGEIEVIPNKFEWVNA